MVDLEATEVLCIQKMSGAHGRSGFEAAIVRPPGNDNAAGCCVLTFCGPSVSFAKQARSTCASTLHPLDDKPMKLGRNDPCHCGSGQKYKKCHESADDTAARTELAALAAARAAAAKEAAAQAEADAEKSDAESKAAGKPTPKAAPGGKTGPGTPPKQTSARPNPAMRPKRAV